MGKKERNNKMSRLETGKVRCDGDWSGIFIRGDAAKGHATSIAFTLSDEKNKIHPVNREMLTDLMDLLNSADEHNGIEPQPITNRIMKQKFDDGKAYSLNFHYTGKGSPLFPRRAVEVLKNVDGIRSDIQSLINIIFSFEEFDEGFVIIRKK